MASMSWTTTSSPQPPLKTVRHGFQNKRTTSSLLLCLPSLCRSRTSSRRSAVVRMAALSKEDLSYLSKLAAGSVGGAIFIKYGSALIPEITKPNGFVALLLVGLPMLVSVFLLSKAK